MDRLRKDQRVRYVNKPDWGKGLVLQDQSAEEIRIFFTEAGERTIHAGFRERLVVLSGKDAEDPLLDNLHLPEAGVRSSLMVTMTQARARFLELFPSGFYGERFIEEERSYKERLRDQCLKLLGRKEIERLIGEKTYDSVVERAALFITDNGLNLPHHIEKMAFRDRVRQLDAGEFSDALWHWMYADEPIEQRLLPIRRELSKINAAKWPILTSFTFFSSPNRSVFIKPENLKYAAEVCRFEINYKPELNALTLESVSRFYDYLARELTDLKPRDMLDVQSFIWCIDPKNYPA